MTTVTLTTDLGNGSFELAAMKGALLCRLAQNDRIVDISNEIKAFNLIEASFILSNSYTFYPSGSIHIISINPFYNFRSEILLIKQNDHFFIAPNNGFLPLLFEDNPNFIAYKLGKFNTSQEYFQIIAKIVGELSLGIELSDSEYEITEVNKRISLKAVISKDSIRGSIIYIDNFGNVISNITKQQFIKIGKGRSFAIYFRHKDPVTEIKDHYYQVQVGEELCIFNLSNKLEIAINMANANELLGLKLDDIIQVHFYNKE